MWHMTCFCCDSGYSTMDKVSDLSRPNAKSIYRKLTLLQLTWLTITPFYPVNNTELWFVFTVQRKMYAASVDKMIDTFQYRVEVTYVALSRKIWPFIDDAALMLRRHTSLLQHLITCELDGMELRNVADCVERLKLLEEMGRVWGQSMLLEVRAPKLLLIDIETKVNKSWK